MVDSHRPVAARGLQPLDDPTGLIGPARVSGHQLRDRSNGLPGPQVVREGQHPLIPELPCAFHQFALGAGVVQHHVGNGPPFVVAGLGGDSGAGVVFAHPPLLNQALHSQLGVGVHHDDERKQRRHTRLDQ